MDLTHGAIVFRRARRAVALAAALARSSTCVACVALHVAHDLLLVGLLVAVALAQIWRGTKRALCSGACRENMCQSKSHGRRVARGECISAEPAQCWLILGAVLEQSRRSRSSVCM